MVMLLICIIPIHTKYYFYQKIMSHKRHHDKHISPLTDKDAKRIQDLWTSDDFPGVTAITLPSAANGVFTMAHGMHMPLLKINHLVSQSPLSNSALLSNEVAYDSESGQAHYLNLYEAMIPDIPGKNGIISTSQYYINLLHKYGLDVAGVHFHWTGASVFRNDHLVTAVHHQNIGMHPTEFSKLTIKALQKTMVYIDSVSKLYPKSNHHNHH